VQLVAGLLTQELYGQNNERIGLGVVTQASYIRDTLALLDRQPAQPQTVVAAQAPGPDAETSPSAPTFSVGP
jgi:hypothetical protein